MRISFHTLGTRGDVQPYMALGLQLRARGHDVQLVVPAQYAAMVRGRGLTAVPLSADFLALMDTPEGKAAIGGGTGFAAGIKLLKYITPLMRTLLEEDWAAAAAFEPDVLVYHPKALAIPHVAERLGRPAVLASPLPGFTPTSAFASPLLPFRTLGPLNRLSHALAINGGRALFGKVVARWREEILALPGRGKGAAPATTLYGYSPALFPPPADWTGKAQVTGYWFLDSPEWHPDQALAAFLAAGPPPVYFGFGSMPGLDPVAFTKVAVDAVGQAGKRAVLAVGGGALRAIDLPAEIMQLESAPHDRLLPLVGSAVHHGGAGTTAAVLRAGRPMTIIPFFGDQPFWGRLIAEQGLGPPPLDRKSLSPTTLAEAIIAMDGSDMRARACHMSELISQEDGVATACDAIEAVAATGVS